MKESILVTGAAGFAGSHLLEFLLRKSSQDWTFGKDSLEVHGVDRPLTRRDNIRHLEGAIVYHETDLTDFVSTLSLLRKISPDRIFHLAGQSFVPTSWKAPEETLRTNINAELNIFEACRELGIRPRIQIACSSEEYGLVLPYELPITEANPLRPLSPYAVSKVAQDMLGYQYFKSYGLPIIRTRAFNHTGPRRGEQFATSAFAKQIAELEVGARGRILVGNLDTLRDLTDVRDMVQGYWMATEKGEPGEVYNLCSGRAYPMKDVLQKLLDLAGIPDARVEQDPDRMRPSDVPVLLGNPDKFRERTGWASGIPIEKTLKDLLTFWREKIAGAR
jgi:GDP-4-dehydro-6-deoxy-D-mannose reductase